MKRAQLILHCGLAFGVSMGLGACQPPADEDGGSTSKGDSGSDSADAGSDNESGKDSGSTDSAPESSGDTKPDQTGSSDPGEDSLTPDTYCAAFSKVVCKGDADCCEDSAKKFESVATCEVQIKQDCEKDILVLVSDARTGFDGKEAKVQLDRLETLVQSCSLDTAKWFAGNEGLMAMYKGTVAPGESCTPKDADDAGAMLSCKDGYCLLKPVPLSGACNEKGLTKDTTCYAHVECEPGLYCTAPKGLSGKCATPGATGASCTDGFGCASYYCEDSKCVDANKNRVYCAKD